MSEIKDIPEIRLDKTKIKVVKGFDNSEEIEYWRNASTKERLQHLERMRRMVYGAKATARFQRTIQIIKRERS